MLFEEEDPLGSSMFSANTVMTNTLTFPAFTQFEEDPWGNHTDIGRSFTTPNFTHHSRTNSSQYTVSNVLFGVVLPSIYQQLYTQHQRSGRVTLPVLNTILSKGKISAQHIEKIMQIVAPNGTTGIPQTEFNTAIALLVCAQNKIDVSLESLYKNKNYLPEPDIKDDQVPITATNKGTPNFYPGMKPSKSDKTIHSSSSTLDTSQWFQNQQEINVSIAPEREGFIFKYVNYILTNKKQSSIVLRRYSDFWWLLEVLMKRYPFRALPNLPPKKFSGRDEAFLEKRRRGLSRFINAVVQHPVLRHDDIVNRFLTEPSELLAWRKQNPPDLSEEFLISKKSFDNVPPQLQEQIQSCRKRISAALKHYVNLGLIMERMIRRMHGQATDFSRYSIALNSLAEGELRFHASECINCHQVVKGYENVAKTMQTESSLLVEQAEKATDGVLEDLKKFRDLLVSFRDLDERLSKLSVNQIESISKRIAENRAKIHQNKGVPGLESQVERLEESVQADEAELTRQRDREMFMQHCIWSELTYLHKQQAFMSCLYQRFVKDTIQFSKLRATNWQELEEPVFQMPSHVDLFE